MALALTGWHACIMVACACDRDCVCAHLGVVTLWQTVWLLSWMGWLRTSTPGLLHGLGTVESAAAVAGHWLMACSPLYVAGTNVILNVQCKKGPFKGQTYIFVCYFVVPVPTWRSPY